MKVVSYNVRRLGGFAKRAEVRRFVQEKLPYVLCLQESKFSVVDDLLITSLWGNRSFRYSYQTSVGASGGIITIWDTSLVVVTCSWSFRHVLVIKGKVISSGLKFIIANTYAPCDTTTKHNLWAHLSQFILNNTDVNLCICGDFNVVRSEDERKGRGSAFRQVDIDNLNNFIDACFLIDLPLCGRLFTWYKGDGITMSRLDIFLLSARWCASWPNSIQVAHKRGLSDHVPLVLDVDDANWGPRPLRMLKCWADFNGYSEFVRDKLTSFSLSGWGGYVLQKKLKMIKFCLKDWHQHHSKNLVGKLSEMKDRISSLDIKGEEVDL